MADIFTGRLGGTPARQFPWVFKPADLLDVEVLGIEIDHTPGRGWFSAGSKAKVSVDVLSAVQFRHAEALSRR